MIEEQSDSFCFDEGGAGAPALGGQDGMSTEVKAGRELRGVDRKVWDAMQKCKKL